MGRGVTHIFVNKLNIIDSDNGLSPSRYQTIAWKQCWNIVYFTPRNALQWDVNQNLYSFVQGDAFEHDVCKMAAILTRTQCVKWWIQFLSACMYIYSLWSHSQQVRFEEMNRFVASGNQLWHGAIEYDRYSIMVTSKWARWRLKLQASPLFTRPFI